MNDVRSYFDEKIDVLENEISKRRQELKALEKMLELKRDLGEKSEKEKRKRWVKKEISYCDPFETYEERMEDEGNPFEAYAPSIMYEAPKPRVY